MKHFYFKSLLAVLLAFIAGAGVTQAQEVWSYDWPKSATSDQGASGFYNYPRDYELTSQTKTLNGHDWTINVPAGTYFAYLASSKQAVGNSSGVPEEFTLVSNDFEGLIEHVTVKARQNHANATVSVSVGGVEYVNEDGATAPSITASSASKAKQYTFKAPEASGAQKGEIVVTFKTGETTSPYYIIYLEVATEEEPSSVADPVISPAAGVYDEAQTVSITATEGATIVYTLDGSDPRTEGNEATVTYSEPFLLTESAMVKAAAKIGDEFSRVAKADIKIRQEAGLSFDGTELTVEYPEDSNGLKLNNPNKVTVKYSSSDTNVAAVYSSGAIIAMGLGDCVITAKFDGDDNYLPQTLSYNLHIIAKEPLAAPTFSIEGGEFDHAVELKITGPADERFTAFNYMISDEEPVLDEYGAMPGSCQSAEAPEFTLTLDKSCTVWVQAKGHLLWSPMVKATFDITLTVEADFMADECNAPVWSCNFDAEEELADWTQSSGAEWGLSNSEGFLYNVPAFSAINPESKNSLVHAYTSGSCDDILLSPQVTVPDGATMSFWCAFNPVWIYDQNLTVLIYADDNVKEAWNAFLASQEAATDDANWNKYTVDLAEYAGKTIQIAFRFEGTYGDNVMIDDLAVYGQPNGTEISASIDVEGTVHFQDASTGYPTSWEWSFPGGMPATSTEANPAVTYNEVGNFDVTLTVTNAKGQTSTITRKGFVKVNGVAPKAAIKAPEGLYYSPEAHYVAPLNVPLTFKDASKGLPTAWAWTLPGTDIQTSTDSEVTVKYITAGSYDVDLTVKNDNGQSSTYIHGINAGVPSLAWNIPVEMNDQLGIVELGWYGNYGGSNWLGIEKFAEKFAAPAASMTVSKVNIYFASVEADTESADVDIEVAVAKAGEDGMPGDILGTTTLKVKDLVDASETYNDPTEFLFDSPIKIDGEFFVIVSGIPNNGYDNLAMYAVRRNAGEGNSYHYMSDQDDYGNDLGTASWYYNEGDPVNFAIAPHITFDSNGQSGIDDFEISEGDTDIDFNAPVDYYTLQGVRVSADRLAPGIYIARQGARAAKVLVK